MANFAVTPWMWKQIFLCTSPGNNLECLADTVYTFLEFEVAFKEAKFSTSLTDKCKQSSCPVSCMYSVEAPQGTTHMVLTREV